MYRYFFCFVIILLYNSCSNKKNRAVYFYDENGKYGLVNQIRYIKEGKLYTKNCIEDNTITIKEYLDSKPYGRFLYLDSNHIVRKIEWYHLSLKPFCINYFDNIYTLGGSYFNDNYIDTSLITIPTIRTQIDNDMLFIEFFAKDYPVNLIEIHVKIPDSLVNYKMIITNNSWYDQFYNNKTKEDFFVDFDFYNSENKIIKTIKNVKVEYPLINENDKPIKKW